MTGPGRRLSRVASRRGAAGALIVAAVIGVMSYLGARLYHDAAALRVTPNDNVQWTLSRLEVEALRLELALRDEEVARETLMRRFDVFYSRVVLIVRGASFAPLRADPEISAEIERLSVFLERVAPVFDGPEPALTAARAALADDVAALRAGAALIALNGVSLYAKTGESRRAAFEELVLGAALLALALIAALAVSLVVLLQRHRAALTNEREAEDSRARMNAVVEVALDPIVVADAEGRVIEYNAAAAQVFGHARDEAIGREMADLFIPPDMREAHRAGMSRYLASGDPHVVGKGRLELEAVRASGERFPVELAVAEARSTGGAPIFIGFMRDISQRVRQERELTLARDAAMAAGRAKSRFIAVMSHEMRTPLNGVLGVLDLLKESPLNRTDAEYVDIATRSGEILLRHINDVLDVTRIEAGRLDLAHEPVDLKALLEEAAAIGKTGAAGRGVTLTVEAPGAAPLMGDPYRIGQVLLNLVGNAVKFTPSGRIELKAERVAATLIADEIEFSVTDEGPGVGPEDQERIFDDFVMLDTEYDREAGGSGLGLAICRRIVRAMGGRIGVESAPGKGSRFWFRLHLERGEAHASAPDPAPAAPARLTGAKALLVEDNETNRVVAGRMLTGAGLSVAEARDGLEGVECAAAEAFDLVFMDVSMPRMDGVEATRRIRKGGASSSARIIGLTAHASPAEQAAFLDAGMDHCLTKPLRRRDLDRLLGEVAGATPAADTETHQPEAPPAFDEDTFDEFIEALDEDEAAAMLRRVCSEMTGMAARLDNETGDALAASAHKTAGAAALVGAFRAQAALIALERAARADESAAPGPEAATARAAMAEAVTILEEVTGG